MSASIRKLGDLARIAGLSVATVSRALHNHPAVNRETKNRIVQLAIEHGFPFQRYAPLESSGTGPSIAVVIPPPLARQPRLSDPFLMELLAGIGEAGQAQGCDIIVSHMTPANYSDLSQFMRRSRANGVIYLGQSSLHDSFNALVDLDPRFAVWGAEVDNQRYCSVGSDNRNGGMRATRHLLRLGRQRIAFLGSPLNMEIQQRYEGYAQAFDEVGRAPDPTLVIDSYYDLTSAECAVEAFILSGAKFDAIVAASDILGFGAIRALNRSRLRVPDDVAVVGYDNVSFGRYVHPAVSTISQDVQKAGQLFISKLINASKTSPPLSERIATDLIVRESCGG